MAPSFRPRRSWTCRIIRGIGVGSLAALASGACAQDNLPLVQPTAPRLAPAAPSAPLTLSSCLAIALERQPAIAAQQASLAAAQEGSRTLQNLRVPAIIVHELPIRRRQACLGVQAAAAGVDVAERETAYAVTRNYFTVIFAREQEKVARTVVDNLKATQETAQRLLEGGSKDITTSTVDKIGVYLGLARTRQVQASEGVNRALDALREAMGVGPEFPLTIADQRLPEVSTTPDKTTVIALALSRRGELAQVGSLAEITALEVDAQGTSHRPKMQTFAAFSDIHARLVPQGVANTEYRPSAVGPEMPTELAGPKSARMEIARDYSARAAAVVEKTRNLIALEAANEFALWSEATRQLAQTRDASTRGARLADDSRKDFAAGQNVKPEDVLTNQVLASTAQGQHNETLYHQILALAALERITAGGFNAGIPAAK